MGANGSGTSAPRVDVLLGTFNEARYVDAFMHSMLAQTYPHWRLIARDDGSSDGTQARLEDWQVRLGTRLTILPDSGQGNLGIAGNFSRLLAESTASHVMFANPDDLWRSDKIALTLGAMTHLETQAGTDTPCLVHTDLRMVDEHLALIAPSLWQFQGLVPERARRVSRICVENIVWACTTMINRALVARAGSVPRASHNEDWWMALVAAAFGRIASMPETPIDWRRRENAATTTSEPGALILRTLASPASGRRRLHAVLAGCRPRAQAFLDRFGPELMPRDREALEAFLALPDQGPVRKRLSILQHRLFFSSWRRTVGMLLLI